MYWNGSGRVDLRVSHLVITMVDQNKLMMVNEKVELKVRVKATGMAEWMERLSESWMVG